MAEKIAGATIRQQIISCLTDGPMNAIEISQHVRIMEKEVYEHLPHVGRSANAGRKKLIVTPSRCLACRYVFKSRKRYTPPSRCPQCKSERIGYPAYRIIS
jgi:predicted Zn-ribbon and HTH transcriptional regulator